MDRRQFVTSAVAGGAALSLAKGAARRPNVVVILADDQGWGDLSLNGNRDVRTPRIDSLAADGASFDRFYACPLCAPCRAEYMTGRYHARGGVRGVSTGQERLNLDERTIADVFGAAGYATGCFGKWHNGSQWPYHPNARGWDEFYGFTSGHWGQYFSPMLEHNGRPIRGHGYIADDLTDHALQFIDQHRDRPFFCYVPYNTPHSPWMVPDEYWNRFADKDIERVPKGMDLDAHRCVLAMTENLDDNVGRVLDQLAARDLERDTIVVYWSDNGPNGARPNGGMRSTKGSTDEGGVRVPCLVRWPGEVPAGHTISTIAAGIDFLPTLTRMCGVPLPQGKPLDGLDLSAQLRGGNAVPDRMILSHQGNRISVRTQQYRLDDKGRLYDMVADPGQTTDIASDQPGVAAKLKQAVEDWKAEVAGELGPDERPFPVGYPAFPNTTLPARDGVASGGVKRSAGAPNCSYFTEWTSLDGRITWDIEVATPGMYEAVVLYTCPAADVGSTVELTFGDSVWQGKVTDAFDPPLQTGQDRSPRKSESLVKEWRQLSLRADKVAKRRGLLTLRATQIAGGQAMDVRSVILKLVAVQVFAGGRSDGSLGST